MAPIMREILPAVSGPVVTNWLRLALSSASSSIRGHEPQKNRQPVGVKLAASPEHDRRFEIGE
jgi:hypothetical protein